MTTCWSVSPVTRVLTRHLLSLSSQLIKTSHAAHSRCEWANRSGRCALKASIPGLHQTTGEGSSLEWWTSKGVWGSGFLPKMVSGDKYSPLSSRGVHGSDSNFVCLSFPFTILRKRNSLYPRTSPFIVLSSSILFVEKEFRKCFPSFTKGRKEFLVHEK